MPCPGGPHPVPTSRRWCATPHTRCVWGRVRAEWINATRLFSVPDSGSRVASRMTKRIAHHDIQLRFSFRSEENHDAEEISIHAGFDRNSGHPLMGTGLYPETHPALAKDSLAQIYQQ